MHGKNYSQSRRGRGCYGVLKKGNPRGMERENEMEFCGRQKNAPKEQVPPLTHGDRASGTRSSVVGKKRT